MKDRLGAIILLLTFVAAIWVVYLVNSLLFDGSLNRYGLSPMALPYHWLSEFEPSLPYLRQSQGILLSPLLHGSFSHLMSNTFRFSCWAASSQYARKDDHRRIAVSDRAGWVAVWIVGRPAVHIGASGLVFGYFGFLVAQGWYERSIVSIVVAVGVLLLYGGIIFGVLPQAGFISWEGHLFGLIAGVLAARISRQQE